MNQNQQRSYSDDSENDAYQNGCRHADDDDNISINSRKRRHTPKSHRHDKNEDMDMMSDDSNHRKDKSPIGKKDHYNPVSNSGLPKSSRIG